MSNIHNIDVRTKLHFIMIVIMVLYLGVSEYLSYKQDITIDTLTTQVNTLTSTDSIQNQSLYVRNVTDLIHGETLLRIAPDSMKRVQVLVQNYLKEQAAKQTSSTPIPSSSSSKETETNNEKQ